MKMTPNHYAYLEQQLAPHLSKQLHAEYRSKGISDKKYRWDAMWAARIESWVCDVLYRYLDDDHIDTALKKLTGTK